MTSHIVQSILLKREKFSKAEAFKWVREHGYKADKVDVTHDYYRFRQVEPSILHLLRPKTISLGDVGQMIVGYSTHEA